MQAKTQSKAKGSSERKAFSFEFNKVKFPSQPSDVFRASVSSASEAVVLWVESKKSKQQWQASITKISDVGPVGVPEGAVLAFLKKALELLSEQEEDAKTSADDPQVDLDQADGEMVLTLTLSMGGIWKPEFVFALLPVGLEKVDMLEAKVRDAQEEIESLRAQLAAGSAPAYLSISSATACANQQMVTWDAAAPVAITASHFELSADKKQVTVLKEGLYQVNVRLAGTNYSNTQSLGLQVNAVEVAQCTQSDANGHQNSPQLHELMILKANDTLQVRCGADGHSQAVAEANRFTMLYLGNPGN
ncbi:hypothetical protein B484DRAFT_450172 [Ochromonadaceae sp. CCMP2298]|nr:hypothetical protein B484DRAFT_450172 [Ochromonadaceae sp. CCMP2298]|mmetsp:Transcript_22083/g.49092  ORF Transcript_22083/g.49092 Transcript_22083/m.49092 type:complete len:304 (+) Transcript_22083:61-972(+)